MKDTLPMLVFVAAMYSFCTTASLGQHVEAFQYFERSVHKKSAITTKTISLLQKRSIASKKTEIRQGRGLSFLQSSNSENTVQAQPPLLVEFTTPEMYVFIEDTDAYGVMYNSNYLRAYDRALHMVAKSNMKTDSEDDILVDADTASILDHEGWSLVEVSNQKFKRSPPLGGAFVVHGKLKSKGDNNRSEVWDLELTSPPLPTDHGDDTKEIKETELIIYNTATVTIAQSDLSSRCIPKAAPLTEGVGSITAEHTFTLYRDEFDMHLPTHLPLRNVLNLFERSRTMALGGPDTLRNLQEQDDLLFVVTKNDKCCLVNLGHDETDVQQGTPKIECCAGQSVLVRTTVERKRRGMILECKQTLLLPKNSKEEDRNKGKSGGRRLAQAIITLMVLNGTTRKPTSDIPEYVLDSMSERSN